MNKLKFLVTGGAGFIGSHLVERLVEDGHFVRVIDNLSTGKLENIQKFVDDIELVKGDIRDYDAVFKSTINIDVILHEAALPSVPRSITDPITTNDVNVGGTLNLLDAAKENKVKRIVMASSSSVYGNSKILPKTEAMTPNPLSPYAVSKLAGEYYCRVFNNLFGLEAVILRYFNVFGPRQDPNSQYSAVIPKFIKAFLDGRSPVIYGDGNQSRDFTYISNVVDCNILAATSYLNEVPVLNCAAEEQVTINDLVGQLNLLTDSNISPVYEEPSPGDIKHSYASVSLAQKILNYSPKINFKSGLNLTLESFKEEVIHT